MNIPLDRLYHYIENIASEIYGDTVLIYRFFPHGSKNINDLNRIREFKSPWLDGLLYPIIWCHDQEPLNHEFYSKNLAVLNNSKWHDVLRSINIDPFLPKNLNYRPTIFDKGLLLHSETRSDEISKYQLNNQLIPVYYWNHAILARDWFRYAEHETFQKQPTQTFLIYNRAWSGTREYRLKLADLLIENNLVKHCQITVNPQDPELSTHYKNYNFKNPQWQPKNVLENFLQFNTADSASSADFTTNDYNSTDIEVVLETLFDDSRLHLTEKSIRPIACGQPFILAATHGSLAYLRSYGFKTFDTVWKEDYDLIADPHERLQAIVAVMQEIISWPPLTRETKIQQAREIAKYNRQWFFSQEFFNLIVSELKNNLDLAFRELESCDNYTRWYNMWKTLLTYPEVINFLNTNQSLYWPKMDTVNQILLTIQNRLAVSTNTNEK